MRNGCVALVVIVTDFSSSNICSTTTAGGRRLVRTLLGVTATRPRLVENQSFPSSVLQPAACKPLEHLSVGNPSLNPKVRKCACWTDPSAHAFNSDLATLIR